MSEQEKIWLMVGYILDKLDCCPFEKEWEGTDLEKECVGFGEVGCGDCILKHLDKLDC